MNLRYVRLENVGRHELFEQRFTKGLIGVFGPNGTGKSTLLNSVYAALTNDFGRFAGVKEDMIRDTAPKGAKSSIEVEIEHGGVVFSLTRQFRPNRSRLKVGDVEFTKANEIDVELRKLLGVPLDLLNTYVFVDQWKMFAFLSQTPAQRAESFRTLCRTEASVRLHKLCDDALSRLPSVDEFLDDAVETRTAIGGLEERRRAIVVDRDAAKRRQLKAAAKQTFDALIALAADLPRRQQRLSSRTAAFQAAKKTRDAAFVYQERTESAYQAAHAKALEQGPLANKARAQLQAWETYRRQTLAVREVEQSLDDLEDVQVPESPGTDEQLEALRDELRVAQSELTEANGILRKDTELRKKTGGAATCPTCGQPVKSVAFLDDAKATTQRLTPKVLELERAVDVIQTGRKATDRALELQRQVERRRAELQTDLARRLRDAQNVVERPEDAERTLKEFAAAEQVDEATRKTRDRADVALAEAATALAKAKDEGLAAKAAVQEATVDPAELQKATEVVAAHVEAVAAVLVCDTRLEEIDQQLIEKREHLQRLDALRERRERAGRAAEILEAARDVFHWSRLPNLVARRNLQAIKHDLNKALTDFGDPFRAEPTEDLGFVMHSPGRPEYPAEQLSGGQRVVFATAVRVALNGLFNSDLGMMTLDEPTAGLDEDNIAYMAQVFERLAGRVRDKRQLIVITHENQLRPSFDQVVELSP